MPLTLVDLSGRLNRHFDWTEPSAGLVLSMNRVADVSSTAGFIPQGPRKHGRFRNGPALGIIVASCGLRSAPRFMVPMRIQSWR